VTDVGVRRAGDRGSLLEVPDGTAARVAQQIGVELGGRLVDVVPGHRTVLVTWDFDPPSDGELTALAVRAIDRRDPAVAPRTVEIPVTYDGEDLASVAELVGMSVEEVVRTHTAPEYTAAFLGFQPGFAYLVGGDERLQVPRRDEPRQRVPEGSVAVAGPYSGVYPREGPGGWQLLGTTTAVLFDPDARPPALLAAGDRVRFVAE
jgi:KipI family sensor histidine kinase inhibitor